MKKKLCKRCRAKIINQIKDKSIRDKFKWSETDDEIWKRKSVICFENYGEITSFSDGVPDCCIYKLEHVV